MMAAALVALLAWALRTPGPGEAVVYKGNHTSLFLNRSVVTAFRPDGADLAVPGRLLFLGEQRPPQLYNGTVELFFSPQPQHPCYAAVQLVVYTGCPRIADDVFRSCLHVSSYHAPWMHNVNVSSDARSVLRIADPGAGDSGRYTLRVRTTGSGAGYDLFDVYVLVHDVALAERAVAELAAENRTRPGVPRITFAEYVRRVNESARAPEALLQHCHAAPAGGPHTPTPAGAAPGPPYATPAAPTGPRAPPSTPAPPRSEATPGLPGVPGAPPNASIVGDARIGNGSTPAGARVPAPARALILCAMALLLVLLVVAWVRCARRVRRASRTRRKPKTSPEKLIYTPPEPRNVPLPPFIVRSLAEGDDPAPPLEKKVPLA
ncbi:envelope glycoprotein I [Beluga whale alphaherpesvirus 1]|uniref:Envelope glycoprotein I n=1 Tax=Beluga whale alphaherpesvirus 1 TaxID=1434720 RepID=A0A286MM86_9ALPH|nr:envelope glycoprotein I [Beluga whale alphaherpesvirus 1]ASW27112.1 envelope glycoprotein I [Beluga whale alphaherpesvirus 1]